LSEGDWSSLNGQDHATAGAASKSEVAAMVNNALLTVIEVTFIFEAEEGERSDVRMFVFLSVVIVESKTGEGMLSLEKKLASSDNRAP
jgi:hypothetical protein